MKFKSLSNQENIVHKTCISLRKETNPTSFLWVVIMGSIINLSCDEYNAYNLIAAIIVSVFSIHFIFKFRKVLDEISEYIIYRNIISFIVVFICMIIIYFYPQYMFTNVIIIAIFLWINPLIITGIAFITPTLIDIILLGKIKDE